MDKDRLPYKITEYINEHFREDFLFDVKNVRKVKGHTYYTIEITKDNFIETLMFNEQGVLVKDESEDAFPGDMHEEPGFGTVPD